MTIEGGLALSAGRDISLDTGRSQQYEETRRGRTHTIDSHTRVQSTTLDAVGNLALQAGNDITLTAAQLRAGGDASLLAGNRIDLLTAQEEDYSLYEYRRRGGLLSSSRHQRDEVHDTRDVGTQIGAGDDIAIVSGGDQSYRGARLDAGQDLALLSGGEIAFDMASDLRPQSHERSRSNALSQSARGHGSTEETLRQSELMAQGELLIHADQGIHALYEARGGESLDAAIERVVANDPDLAWLQALQGRDDVTWESIEAFQDEWSYSQSGLSPLAAQVLAAVAAYYTAGAASSAIGSLSGSQATFSAGLTSASGTGVAAGTGNAILSGMAGGAVGGGVGAFSQGGDWQEAAWRGGVTGGFTGYLSAGTYTDNPIHMAGQARDHFIEGNAMGLADIGKHLGTQRVYGEIQQKLADGVGLSSEELNWLLMAGSIVGNEYAGTRFNADNMDFNHTDEVGTTGFFTRDRSNQGSIFDTVDSLLGYQDLPDASVREQLTQVGVGQAISGGHSLGTITQSYLARHGLVNHAYLEALPFGIVAPPNSTVKLGSGDPINGFYGGLLFNWHADMVPLGLFEHAMENYKPFRSNSGETP